MGTKPDTAEQSDNKLYQVFQITAQAFTIADTYDQDCKAETNPYGNEDAQDYICLLSVHDYVVLLFYDWFKNNRTGRTIEGTQATEGLLILYSVQNKLELDIIRIPIISVLVSESEFICTIFADCHGSDSVVSRKHLKWNE